MMKHTAKPAEEPIVTAVRRLLVILLLVWASTTHAQVSAPAAPMPSHIDEHGVDLTSGKLIFTEGDLAIGPADHHGLRFSRQWSNRAWRPAELPTISGSSGYLVVSFGGRSYPFESTGSGYKPVLEDGSTINGSLTSFTSSDGTQITFTNTGYQDRSVDSNLGIGTQVVFPDGVVWTYHYETQSAYMGPPIPPECASPQNEYLAIWCMQFSGQWTTYYGRRLSSITSSTGYQIKLGYASSAFDWASYNGGTWWLLAKATAINNAVEYCNPTAPTCSLSNTWPEVTYSGISKTDSIGTTNYTFGTSSTYWPQLEGIRPPGASSNLITFGYTTEKVTSVSRGGSTWSYAYPSATQSKVTDPSSNVRTINYNGNALVTSIVAGGQTTSFVYCGASEANCPVGLLKKATMPEGNYVQYAYDARGNVTSETRVAKSGSGLANIVTSAAYPSSCTNQKTCNKPVSTTDARGQVTDYEWNTTHGGLNWVRAPADAGGVRPETRVTYATKQARYLTGPSTWTVSANIHVPTATSSCRTATSGNPASCVGTAEERVTTVAYPANTTPNNLQPTSVTSKAGNNTLVATSSITYDNYGRAVTVDGPLSGTADTSKVRYNLAGQVIGEVAPDPDDTGTSKYPATRYTYDAAGRLSMTETGTVNGLGDTDWAAFSATGNTLTEFDSYGRPVRQKLRNGTTSYQITDYRYDTMGRVQCSMVRMDTSSWGTLPSSCSPTQTTGPNGPDRVTYNHYDTLGRVWKVTTGYGTSVAADEQIATFTNNGRLKTLTDAEGNKTEYRYDGHDRLVWTLYPHPTTAGAIADCVSPNPCDVEIVGSWNGSAWVPGYDANGNVTSFRTRRAEILTMTYDNLGRLTLKNVPTRSGLATTHTRDVYFGYDLFGNMTYARFDSTSGEGITNAYDALGRLTSTTTNMDSVSRALSYQYDVAGNLTRIYHPDGNNFNYVRRASGAFYTAQLNGSALLYPVLDAAARPYRLYRWDTAAATWTNQYSQFGYDAVSRVSSIATLLPGTSHDTTTTFTYNPASQLASSSRTNDTYAFTGHVNVNRGYTANGLNQYTAAGSVSFGYDTNGNLTSDGTNTYVYDVENRLVTRSGGASATLRYDPLGRLYEVTGASGTRRFLYDGSDLVAEYNTSGTLLRRYVHGLGAGDDPLVWFEGSGVSDAARRYLYADERGSIVAVTNSAGTVLAVNRYDEYGIPGSSNTGAFQYTGQVWLPELGMYHYKARMYSPTLGRFMQTDPIGYGDGMNMYAYVKSDPVNGVDPTGLSDLGIDDCYRQMQQSSGYGAPTGADPCQIVVRPSFDWGAEMQRLAIGKLLNSGTSYGSDPGYNILESLQIDVVHEAELQSEEGEPIVVTGARLANRAGHYVGRGFHYIGRGFDYIGRGFEIAHDAVFCCFTAGTSVSTPSGLTPIEELEVGDLVISRSDETGETAAKPIVSITPAHERRIWTVTVSYKDEDGRWRDERYETTDDHPWRTADNQWVVTGSLKAGQLLIREDGTAVVAEVVDTGSTKLTYNLEIADFHTYFVGSAQAWVHNACMSPNQMNQAWRRGLAPRGIGRTDIGKVPGEQQHTIIQGVGAINIDGTWKHGGGPLTRAQADWLRAAGYNIP